MRDDLEDILEYLPDREGEALSQRRFRTPELCDRLLERIDEIRISDPRSALIPARFALRLAAKLPNASMGRAWAVWSSVQRALSEYAKAEAGYRIARLYLEAPVDLARFYRREAYLLRDRGHFAAAKSRIARSLAIYQESGDSHARGCALADLATVHFVEGHAEEAVRCNCEALRYLDPEIDADYHGCTVHNLVAGLTRCDQPGARLEVLLREIRQQRYRPGTLPWTKHRWIEGLIFKRRGRFRRAEATLRAARNQLLKLGSFYDAGLVTMDLAELHLSRGEWDKSAELARETLPVFRSLGIEREALAALRLYARAGVSRTLTQTQIQGLRNTLLRWSRANTSRATATRR